MKIHDCQNCYLRKSCTAVISGINYHPKNLPKVMILLPKPTYEEDLVEEPLQSRESEYLIKIIQEAGLLHFAYFTYLLKCFSTDTYIRKEAYRACEKWLYKEIDYYNVSYILSLGVKVKLSGIKAKLIELDSPNKILSKKKSELKFLETLRKCCNA